MSASFDDLFKDISENLVHDLFHSVVALHAPCPNEDDDESICDATEADPLLSALDDKKDLEAFSLEKREAFSFSVEKRAAKEESIESKVFIADTDDSDEQTVITSDLTVDSTIKMLMPPPSLQYTPESMTSLLANFENAVQTAPLGVVNEMLCAAHRELNSPKKYLKPKGSPAVLTPTDPITFEPLSEAWTSVAEIDVSCDALEAELLTASERCAQALKDFEKESGRYVTAQEAAEEEASELRQLLQEEITLERMRQESANLEVERLIEEESKTSESGSHASWVAGSPAQAARQMRRSAPTVFRMDASDQMDEQRRDSSLTRSYAGLGVEMHRLDSGESRDVFKTNPMRSSKAVHNRIGSSNRSAMALDLELAPSTSPTRQMSTRSSSVGKVTPMQSTPQQLGRLIVPSKSTGSLPKHTINMKNGGNPHAWNVEPWNAKSYKGWTQT